MDELRNKHLWEQISWMYIWSWEWLETTRNLLVSSIQTVDLLIMWCPAAQCLVRHQHSSLVNRYSLFSFQRRPNLFPYPFRDDAFIAISMHFAISCAKWTILVTRKTSWMMKQVFSPYATKVAIERFIDTECYQARFQFPHSNWSFSDPTRREERCKTDTTFELLQIVNHP